MSEQQRRLRERVTAASFAGGDLDAVIDPAIIQQLASLEVTPTLLGDMIRYHLGLVDQSLSPIELGTIDRGKRMRPTIALLACAAVGGSVEAAVPLATAIELLNFTLIHDDIQDRSPSRRHRPTVWSLWGEGQAINAGDALFAVSQLSLFDLLSKNVTAETVIRLADALNRMTIAIVTGQTQDLTFEDRMDVQPTDYLEMIGGKTAAIVLYAAWAGAMVGGASTQIADQFGEFGLALGLGFQIRDDILGIWGEASDTGKAAADDIRRRKQSLPILIMRQRVNGAVREELDEIYSQPEIDPVGIERVLQRLAEHDVREAVEAEVETFHHRARNALLIALGDAPNPAGVRLHQLVDSLAKRSG